jgi:hypothetical protein
MPSDWAICTNRLSGRHGSDFVDRFRQRHELDVRRDKGHHHSVLAGLQGLDRPGAVSQPQLAVHGGGSTAPGPRAEDERIGFLGDQQLQPGRHGLGGLARALNDVSLASPVASGDREALRVTDGSLSRGLWVSLSLAPSATTTSP